jgi:copper(I)-binding protein
MIGNLSSRRTLFFTSVAFAVLLVGGQPTVLGQTDTLTVHDAWLRPPTGNRTEAGVFAVVENSSATARAIVGVSTDAADKAELHEMKMSGAMMRMSPVKQVKVPAHGKVELKPGSYHVMLFGLKKTPMVGDSVSFTLTFDDGSTVSAVASVRQDGDMKKK